VALNGQRLYKITCTCQLILQISPLFGTRGNKIIDAFFVLFEGECNWSTYTALNISLYNYNYLNINYDKAA
jgi:hypothetical protein